MKIKRIRYFSRRKFERGFPLSWATSCFAPPRFWVSGVGRSGAGRAERASVCTLPPSRPLRSRAPFQDLRGCATGKDDNLRAFPPQLRSAGRCSGGGGRIDGSAGYASSLSRGPSSSGATSRTARLSGFPPGTTRSLPLLPIVGRDLTPFPLVLSPVLEPLTLDTCPLSGLLPMTVQIHHLAPTPTLPSPPAPSPP